MANYSLTAINVASFPLGESDKVLTLFSGERGLVKAVAKGAKKPGTKIGGRAEVLKVNRLLLASGRNLDIIVQAEEVEGYSPLRRDLARLSYALYYAELTAQFGDGLSEESQLFFEYLCHALHLQASAESEAGLLCLQFELTLLDLLGYRPELDCCVVCRKTITESNVAAFDHDLGGILCNQCFVEMRAEVVKHRIGEDVSNYDLKLSQPTSFKTHVTPLVWKGLVLASLKADLKGLGSANLQRANVAGRRLIQTYIEHKAGRRMKALDLIKIGQHEQG